MKVTNYKIVSAIHPDDLNPQVTELIAEGWEPYGAPLCPSSGPFAQAMIKPVVKPPKNLEEVEPHLARRRRLFFRSESGND
jgi:hypothetical protein